MSMSFRFVAIAAIFAAAAPIPAQNISFLDIHRDIVSSHPGSVAEVIADFNRDGIPDVVVSAGDGSFILLGTGGGKFQAPQSVAVSGLDSLLVADVNGDGNPDLVGASKSGVEVLLGKGDGTFTEQNPVALGLGPVVLKAGDFNGDGHADLAALGSKGTVREITVLFGNGDGSFHPPVIASSSISSLVSLSVADFNDDGRDDIVSGFDAATGSVLLLSGQSDGTFKTSEIISSLLPSPALVEAADVNGDGKPDIIAAYGGSSDAGHAFGVLLNEGDGTFGQMPGPATLETISTFGVSDIIGNGNVDILDLEDGRFVNLIAGLGHGDFRDSPTLRGVDPGIADALAADLNGDGRADLVTANPKTGEIAVRLAIGAGFTLPVEFPSCSGCADIVAGDFNGDGKLDIASGGAAGVVILPGNGYGVFQSPIVSGPGIAGDPLVTADFDGDGILDLAWANGTNGGILLGKGDGTFTAGQTLTGALYLAAGDLNGDGRPDLVGISISNDLVLVWINRGASGFAEPLEFAIPGAGPAALGDVNGDGLLDLVVWNNMSPSLLVFRGNGDGTFDLPYTYGAFNRLADSLTLADLTASGTLDALIPSFTNNILAVLPGVGDGAFLSPVLFPVGDSPVRAVAADFQGMGKKDVVTVDSASGELTWLRNTSQ